MNKKQWENFIKYLKKFTESENKAVLATLRRGLSSYEGVNIQMFQYIYPWLKNVDSNKWNEKTAFLTASLFALWHSGSIEKVQDTRSFGEAFGKLMAEEKASKSTEQRFMAILNSDPQDLPQYLKHAVSLLRSKKIGINWAELAYGIDHWNHHDKYIQAQWARDFWSRTSKTPET
ncbi:MAG: type I-E CRISPR-associated protein Cse2/CasB [Candidatus Helarchaeota archaeon]